MTSETFAGVIESHESQLSPELEEQCLHFLSKNMWGELCDLLQTNKSHKEAIVKFMDNLLDGEYEANVLRRHPDLNFKDTRNMIKKWLWKILKMYKFPKGICPNLLSSHRMGFISHTFHQYQRQQTSHYNWRELVLHTAGDCKRTQRRVVNMLLGLGMIQEAARFATDFQFDDDEFTSELQQERQNYSGNPKEDSLEGVPWCSADEIDKGESGSVASPFHTFPYPRPVIRLISNRQQFLNCVSHLSQAGTVVGVDTEWQTSFDSATDKDCIALIQLAVSDTVYILDVVNLITLSSEDWLHFFHEVFCNDTVIKLGYGLSQDVKILKHTFPYICADDFVQIIDLQTTMDKSVSVHNRKDAKEKIRKRKHKGLSGLTEDYFCKPLDKTYQVSCWSKRPLSKSQVLYAALDAFVLLELYEIALQTNLDLSKEANDLSPLDPLLPNDMDFDERIDMESTMYKEKDSCHFNSNSSSASQCSLPSNQQNVPAISPHSLRVVVDNMLQGLGWSLRSVGVDTIILKNGQSHKDAIALAIRENRVVLTSGKVFQMFCARLGEANCYCVANNKAKKQLQDVLEHFNVRVQKQDILSRCQLCNSKTFILVESEKMRTLKEVKSQLQKCSVSTDKAWSSNPNGFERPEFIPDPDVSACKLMPRLEEVNPKSGPILEEAHLIDMKSAIFRNSGVSIQLEYIPDILFEENKVFYCCVSCGKVYWDGCHYDRVINQLNGLIPLHNDNEDDPSIYDILKSNTHSTEPLVTKQKA